jgi:uncharacterized protein
MKCADLSRLLFILAKRSVFVPDFIAGDLFEKRSLSMPPISVLIKPASGKCNMRCGYCFYHTITDSRKVSDFGFMSFNTLETIIRKVLRFASGHATFSFQGGEPTLCGLDFFKQVVKLQERYNLNRVRIQNCLQTNGLLIDDAWAEFLHDNNVLVGLSLDGFGALHDQYRIAHTGAGTSQRVLEAAALLRRYQVPFNILFVVTNRTAQTANQVYDFFQKQGFPFLQFIPCIDPPEDAQDAPHSFLDTAQFSFFLKHFFDRWASDVLSGKEISIRYFDNLVQMVLGMPPETCSLMGSCRLQFVFEADGGVYPCDFYVTDEWVLGNIHQADILELAQTENARRFMKTSALSPLCRRCKWSALCAGGCRRDREPPAATAPGLNRYCEAYQSFLEHAYPKLLAIARRLSTANPRERRLGAKEA